MTISRRMASVFFMFLDMMDLSVLASVKAACQHSSAGSFSSAFDSDARAAAVMQLTSTVSQVANCS